MVSDDSDSIPVLSGFGQTSSSTPLRHVDADGALTDGLQTLARMAVLGIAYYGAAWLGLVFAIPPGNATAVWPASGIAVSALLLAGRKICPGIWVAAYLISATTGVSTLTAMQIATGNTLEALLAVSLCQRLPDIHRPLYSTSGAGLLLLIGAVSSALAASVGCAALLTGEYIDMTQLFGNWATWWLGDLTGIMLVCPLALTIRSGITWPVQSLRPLEQTLAIMILAVVCQALFGGWLPENTAEGLLYVPLIILFWMVLRLNTSLACLGSLTLAAIAIWGTSRNVGAFATESIEQSLFDLQIFLNAYAVSVLGLAGIVNSEREYFRRNKELSEELHVSRSRLEIARTIQSQLLPTSPLTGPGYQCAGDCRPAEETGGDYFDFVQEDDGSVVMVIGDVCGHGVGAAMLMTETRAYLRALLANSRDLAEVVSGLNRFLQQDLSSNRTSIGFVTLFICRFNPESSTLCYVGAGHQGFVIRASGDMETLDSSEIPLGITQNFFPGECTETRLHPSDIVMLITDGVTDAKSRSGELFRLERVAKAVRSGAQSSVEEILAKVLRRVNRFTGGCPQSDDLTAAFLRVDPGHRPHD